MKFPMLFYWIYILNYFRVLMDLVASEAPQENMYRGGFAL